MSAAAPMQTQTTKPQVVSNSKQAGMLLQRKCACGSPTSSLTGECAECGSRKRLQTKLSIGASNDPLEQEADRVADQVMAAPAHSSIRGAPPHIQRYARQTTEGTDTAPASVDRVLSSSGRPLEPALRQDMEQRFGHDFSRVRVHSGAVGHNVMWCSMWVGLNREHTRGGVAHELTHVMRQSREDEIFKRQGCEKRSLSRNSLPN